MINIKYKFDENSFEKSSIDVITNQIRDKLKDVLCPNGHTGNSTITVTGKSIENLSFSIECCCDKYKKTIKSKLKK